MKDQVRLFKALSDQNRLRILMMLRERPLCVCEIQDILKLATSTVSKHLSILRDAGFIQDVKQNRWVNYHVADQGDQNISALIQLVAIKLENHPQVSQDLIRVHKVDRHQICASTQVIEKSDIGSL